MSHYFRCDECQAPTSTRDLLPDESFERLLCPECFAKSLPDSNLQPTVPRSMTIVSACPSCQEVEPRTVYDVGDGPELSCSNCEWCWPVGGTPAP